jgi:hypothetical protein
LYKTQAICAVRRCNGGVSLPIIACFAHDATCHDVKLLWTLDAAVNDAPLFAKGASTITVSEDAEPYSSTWATNISAGAQEADQSTTFSITCTNSALFSAAPQVSPAGLLIFTVAAGASGSSVCSVRLADSAGATSASEQLTIVVTAGKQFDS